MCSHTPAWMPAQHTSRVCVARLAPLNQPALPPIPGAGAGCAALRTVDHAQQARGRPDLVPADVYVVGLIVAWHPLLWWACGGRWGAVLGEQGGGVGWGGGRPAAAVWLAGGPCTR